MKNIVFRFPTSIRDIKVLRKEYTSKRYKKNIEVMRKMTDFYIRNVLEGRWGEVADGKVVAWTDSDKRQFEKEMWDKCYSYIHDLME